MPRRELGIVAAAALGLVGLCAPGAAQAPSFDCSARGLSRAEIAICQDAQLSRLDERLGRRLASLGRRLNFGQYLGLRHWHSGWGERRADCAGDRGCLAATYRAQGRFLDRLQQCLDTGVRRRGCLRATLGIEHETVRR